MITMSTIIKQLAFFKVEIISEFNDQFSELHYACYNSVSLHQTDLAYFTEIEIALKRVHVILHPEILFKSLI